MLFIFRFLKHNYNYDKLLKLGGILFALFYNMMRIQLPILLSIGFGQHIFLYYSYRTGYIADIIQIYYFINFFYGYWKVARLRTFQFSLALKVQAHRK